MQLRSATMAGPQIEKGEGMKQAIFTIFEDAPGYWFVPYEQEAAAKANPEKFRQDVYQTKIAACRATLALAKEVGTTELHLHGFGSTTTIRKEAAAQGIKPMVYWPAASTKIAPFARGK